MWSFFSQRTAWSYCSPFIILQTVLVFLLFKKIDFYNGIVNQLAKAAFTVYLIHGYLLPYVGVENVISLNIPLITIVHIVACCFGIYLIGWGINLIYVNVVRIVDKPIEKHWKRHRVYSIDL